jgi:hypothetical protein
MNAVTERGPSIAVIRAVTLRGCEKIQSGRSCGVRRPSASLRLLRDVPASPRRRASQLASSRSQSRPLWISSQPLSDRVLRHAPAVPSLTRAASEAGDRCREPRWLLLVVQGGRRPTRSSPRRFRRPHSGRSLRAASCRREGRQARRARARGVTRYRGAAGLVVRAPGSGNFRSRPAVWVVKNGNSEIEKE